MCHATLICSLHFVRWPGKPQPTARQNARSRRVMLLVRAPHDPFAFDMQARAHGRGERGSPPPSDAAPVVALRTSNWQICCPRVLTPGRIICPTFARSFSTFCRHAPWRCCGRHALACGAEVHPRKRRRAPPLFDAAPVVAVRTN